MADRDKHPRSIVDTDMAIWKADLKHRLKESLVEFLILGETHPAETGESARALAARLRQLTDDVPS
jgi:hypothetical protein